MKSPTVITGTGTVCGEWWLQTGLKDQLSFIVWLDIWKLWELMLAYKHTPSFPPKHSHSIVVTAHKKWKRLTNRIISNLLHKVWWIKLRRLLLPVSVKGTVCFISMSWRIRHLKNYNKNVHNHKKMMLFLGFNEYHSFFK